VKAVTAFRRAGQAGGALCRQVSHYRFHPQQLRQQRHLHSRRVDPISPPQLNDHIGIGKPWDLDRSRGGVRLLQPYQARKGQNWYAGTADAIYQNLNFIREHRADNVSFSPAITSTRWIIAR
jgi:hypothetical protein